IVAGISRRAYVDPAFSHVIGYASLRFGTTGLERAFDDLLTGRADPNPLRDVFDDILERQPQPKDLTLTIDKRLQDFAARQLAGMTGAIVAIDPRTGAILAMTSTPSFNATAFSGDPATASAPMAALQASAGKPLIDRARQGVYTPGSIMKVVTASAAHDSGGLRPALWPLSEAIQVSSNIYFAHVGLDVGAERYLDYAKRFGFCAPLAIGSGGRSLPVSTSYVTTRAKQVGCSPFKDKVELASASFGQARVNVTPLQMALVAATVANDGVAPDLYVVREIRAHAADPTKGPRGALIETTSPGSGHRVISSQSASEVRQAMVDAVQGPLGR